MLQTVIRVNRKSYFNYTLVLSYLDSVINITIRLTIFASMKYKLDVLAQLVYW
jgi:hypothetical protein